MQPPMQPPVAATRPMTPLPIPSSMEKGEEMNFVPPAPPSIPSLPQQKPVAPAPPPIQPPKPAMPSMPTMPKAAAPPAPPTPQPQKAPASVPSGGASAGPGQKKFDPGATTDQSAQRLARLLVSEIKLYNEKKIQEGRKNNNLYDVLKDTIEQSRKHYKERMGAALETMPDYFHEELVKTLCEGDASKLGGNYQK
jgi:hypothetical protein